METNVMNEAANTMAKTMNGDIVNGPTKQIENVADNMVNNMANSMVNNMVNGMVNSMVDPEMPRPKVEVKTEPKPYKFKKLTSKDTFPLMRLFKKMNIKEVLNGVDSTMLGILTEETPANEIDTNNDSEMIKAGIGVVVLATNVLGQMGTCENEIYEVLSVASGLDKETIANFELDVFINMISDYIQLPEFKQVFRLVATFWK